MKNINSNKKEKRLYKLCKMGVVIYTLTIGNCLNVWATDDPMAAVNNLSTFFFTLVRGVGTIVLGFAIIQFAIALKNNDAAQRASSILAITGGIVFVFLEPIVNAITT